MHVCVVGVAFKFITMQQDTDTLTHTYNTQQKHTKTHFRQRQFLDIFAGKFN